MTDKQIDEALEALDRIESLTCLNRDVQEFRKNHDDKFRAIRAALERQRVPEDRLPEPNDD